MSKKSVKLLPGNKSYHVKAHDVILRAMTEMKATADVNSSLFHRIAPRPLKTAS